MKFFRIMFFCMLLAFAAGAAETPRLKLAVTSDIHARWNHLERVYAFLATKNPDAVLFCGDLTLSVADVKSYKKYISIFNKHFSKCKVKPVHIVIPGNHDFWSPKGQKRLPAGESLKRFFGTMGMTSQWLRHTEVKGYSIIAVSATDEKGENNHTPDEVKQVSDLIGKAEKAAPGKPVFVMTHCPPAFTAVGSAWQAKPPKHKGWYWRYDLVREMLKGHKQAVSLSGHTHLALQDERSIWQGDFTAISVGVLPQVTLMRPGKHIGPFRPRPHIARRGRNFTYIEVFDKYMMVYRYDANDLKEIKAARRWRIELPYDPTKAVYSDKRFECSVAPQFPAGAKAEIVNVKGVYHLRLVRAKHPEMVHSYKVKLTFDDKKFKTVNFYVASDFLLPKPPVRAQLELPENIKLQPGAAGSMELFPVEEFGKHGKSITARFVIPEKTAKK